MRNLAILANKNRTTFPAKGYIDTVVLDDVPVHCGIIETPEPEFRKDEAAHEFCVLVRVKAFSLNYRDKNLIFSTATRGPENGFYVVGSEFVAEVLEVGPGVTGLSAGDRVVGDNSYPSSGWDRVAAGVPTNHASREMQIFHQAKLLKIPDSMPDNTAAAFSLGAQTTYSMIRRLELFAGANVLVTSAKSNTSLFAIKALKKRHVNVYATSTSQRFENELKRAGVKELIVIPSDCRNFVNDEGIAAVVSRCGYFHFVIDPYFDLHFSRVLDVMATGGKYATCGLYDQYLSLIQKPALHSERTGRELLTVMMKNLSIIGNCLGLSTDLQEAVTDFNAGLLDVVVDSVFSGEQTSEFLARTYNSKDRFGKVVYQYNERMS